jgi:hypothetical protein
VWDLLCAISHIRLAFYCYNLGQLAVITILIDKLGHPMGLPCDNKHFDWSPAVQLGLEHPARVCIRLNALKMKDFPDANELFWRTDLMSVNFNNEADCYDVVPYLRDQNMENALQAQRLYDRHLSMEADARLFLPLLPSRVRALVKQWKDNIYVDAFYRNTSDPPD